MKQIFVCILATFSVSQLCVAENSSDPIKDIHFCADQGKLHGKQSSICHEIPIKVLENVSKRNIILCEKSFQIACIDAHEKELCQKGVEIASKTGNCDENKSFEFRKCCNACKFGIEIKSTLGYCMKTQLNPTDVIESCCNSTPTKSHEITKNDESQPIDISYRICSNPSLCNEDTEMCVDTKDSFLCECKKGFERSDNSSECEDIDECLNQSHNCTSYEICVNEFGTFKCEFYSNPDQQACKCGSGFKPQHEDGIEGCKCIDIDECEQNPCGPDEICDNTDGSYSCGQRDVLSDHCESGYKMVNGICEDIDECAENKCKDGEFCINLPGSHKCQEINCGSGYTKFLKTNCRRQNCHKNDHFCFKKPLRISHFFTVVQPYEKDKKLFTIQAPHSKIFTNFRPKKFNKDFFKFKDYSKSGSIIMRLAPKKDEDLNIEFDVHDHKKKFKGRYLHIYHVYVNNI